MEGEPQPIRATYSARSQQTAQSNLAFVRQSAASAGPDEGARAAFAGKSGT
jgi:hypothetical protein